MHHTANFENILAQHVVAKDAEAHTFAELGVRRSRRGEREQPPLLGRLAVGTQLPHKGDRPRGIASRDVGRDLGKVGFGAAAEPKPH